MKKSLTERDICTKYITLALQVRRDFFSFIQEKLAGYILIAIMAAQDSTFPVLGCFALGAG